MSDKIENKIDLEKFQDDMFKYIAPMGNSKTRIELINVIDELKVAREELISFRKLNEGASKQELGMWLSEALEVMGKVGRADISLLELNIERSKIELSMESHGVTLSKRRGE